MATLLGNVCEKIGDGNPGIRRQIEMRMIHLLQHTGSNDLQKQAFAVHVLCKSIGGSLPSDGLDQLIVDQIVHFFEQIASAKLLVVVAQLIAVLATHRSMLLQHHFLNILDLVLGWLLDSKCTPDLHEALTGLLRQSSGQWIVHADSGVDMLHRLASFLHRPTSPSTPSAAPYSLSVDADSVVRCFVAIVSGLVRCYPPPDVVTPSLALLTALSAMHPRDPSVFCSAIEGLNTAILSRHDRQALAPTALKMVLHAFERGDDPDTIIQFLKVLETELCKAEVDSGSSSSSEVATTCSSLLLSSSLIDIASRHYHPSVYLRASTLMSTARPFSDTALLLKRVKTARSDRQRSFFACLLPATTSLSLCSSAASTFSPGVVAALLPVWSSLPASSESLRLCLRLVCSTTFSSIRPALLSWLATLMPVITQHDAQEHQVALASSLRVQADDPATLQSAMIRASAALPSMPWTHSLRTSLLLEALHVLPPSTSRARRRAAVSLLKGPPIAALPSPSQPSPQMTLPRSFNGINYMQNLDWLTAATLPRAQLVEAATRCASYLIREHLKTPSGSALATLEALVARLTASMSSPLRSPFGIVVLLGRIEREVERSTSSFFAANRRVCRAFFSRIRAQLLSASSRLVEPAFAIEHASLRLAELESAPKLDHEAYMFACLQLADAHRRAGSRSISITALQTLLQRVSIPNHIICQFEGLAAHADFSFERAATLYAEAILTLEQDDAQKEVAWAGLAECSLALSTWNAIDVNQINLPAWASQSSSARVRACASMLREPSNNLACLSQLVLPSSAFEIASKAASSDDIVLIEAAVFCGTQYTYTLIQLAQAQQGVAPSPSSLSPQLSLAALISPVSNISSAMNLAVQARTHQNLKLWKNVLKTPLLQTAEAAPLVELERCRMLLLDRTQYPAVRDTLAHLDQSAEAALLQAHVLDALSDGNDGATAVEMCFERALSLSERSSDTLSEYGRWCARDPKYPKRVSVGASVLLEAISSSSSWSTSEKDALVVLELLETSAEVPRQAFLNTPGSVWIEWIPQLFSLARHENVVVREHCLAMLAGPLLDADPTHVMFALAELQHEEDLGEGDEAWYRPDVFVHLTQRVHTSRPNLFSRLQKLVLSLRLVSNVWAEEWLSHIAYFRAELPRRLRLFSDDPASSYALIMSSLLLLISDLERRTLLARPRTPYQADFQRHHRCMLARFIRLLRLPLYRSVADTDAAATALLRVLSDISTSLSNRRSLRVVDVNPWLVSPDAFAELTVPFPGMPAVCVGIEAHLEVLPTKTRPKRFRLRGDDGNTYTYLLKANEDLHLDQRLLQVIAFCNRHLGPTTQASSYTVVPVSRTAAFLRLVDNATSLYELVQPPAAAFATELRTCLAAANLPATTPRREWPSHIPYRVFTQLTQANISSSNALERAVFADSADACNFVHRRSALAGSTALLSMLGYMVGLGDRHLGNILLEHASGRLCHIDLNLAFDAGRALAVPERVPFRLTSLLQRALHALPFAALCNETVESLRTHRDSLMTMLGSFRRAPLREWTRSGAGACTLSRHRRAADTAMAVTLLRSRLVGVATVVGQHQAKAPECIRLWRSLRPLLALLLKAFRHRRRPHELAETANLLKRDWDALHRQLAALDKGKESKSPTEVTEAVTLLGQEEQQVDEDDEGIAASEAEAEADVEEQPQPKQGPGLNELAGRVLTAVRAFEAALHRFGDHGDIDIDTDDGDVSMDSRGRSRRACRVLDVVARKLDPTAKPAHVLVDELIAEATDQRRLAHMYEGWAAWI